MFRKATTLSDICSGTVVTKKRFLYDLPIQHITYLCVVPEKELKRHTVSTLLLSLFTQLALVNKLFLVSEVGIQLT